VNRAARLYSWGDVRVEQLPVPEPGAGEIVVRIEACGVCGSDALTWYVERKAPVVLGHEPAGVVVAVGDGVEHVRVGERVFIHHHAPCMNCENCRRGLWSNCELWRRNALDPGGFATHVLVRAQTVERDTLPLPREMSFETATFIEPLACCIRAVKRHGRVRPGDTVFVVGLGAMGLLMVQLARVYGARVIVGSDFLGERRERALLFGAQYAFDPRHEEQVTQWRELTGERGADVVMVCPGDARAVQGGIDAAAPGARVVCFTPLPPADPVGIDLSALYFREISLHQSYSCGPDETREALELLDSGKVEVASLITHRAGLDGVAAALERARGKGDGLKTVILPWK
jgi:L-iditol 2-dehydrogenase